MPKFERYAQGTPSYVELTTPDQAAAKEFYGPLFGWELEDVPMGDAGYYVAVEDVDASVEKAAGLGGAVVAPAFDVAGVGRMAVLADPQGGVFNLMAG